VSADTTYRCDWCGDVIEDWLDAEAFDRRDRGVQIVATAADQAPPTRLDFHGGCLRLLRSRPDRRSA
jgi:hypothetical protein